MADTKPPSIDHRVPAVWAGRVNDGGKAFTWMTEIYEIDELGRMTKWVEPYSDVKVQESWVKQGGYDNYVSGLISELEAREMPVPLGLKAAEALLRTGDARTSKPEK